MIRLHYVINLKIYIVVPRRLYLHVRSRGGALWNISQIYLAVDCEGQLGMTLTWDHVFKQTTYKKRQALWWKRTFAPIQFDTQQQLLIHCDSIGVEDRSHLPLIICKTRKRSRYHNVLKSRMAVNVPQDNGFMIAVLDASDVDNGGFEVFESDLKDAVWLGGIVNYSTIGLNHDHAAGRCLDGVNHASKAEEEFYGMLVIENRFLSGCG